MDKPVLCHMKDLLEGISKIGEHEEDVTDLAIPMHSSSHIASASADGLVYFPIPAFYLIVTTLAAEQLDGVNCCSLVQCRLL